eukprot:scpid93435/ scgid22825/ 
MILFQGWMVTRMSSSPDQYHSTCRDGERKRGEGEGEVHCEEEIGNTSMQFHCRNERCKAAMWSGYQYDTRRCIINPRLRQKRSPIAAILIQSHFACSGPLLSTVRIERRALPGL